MILEERKNNRSKQKKNENKPRKVEIDTNELSEALENVSDSVGFRFDSDWLRGWFEFPERSQNAKAKLNQSCNNFKALHVFTFK